MTDASGSEFLELEENVQIDGRSWLRIPLQVALAAVTIVLTAAGLFYANCPAGLAGPVVFVVGVVASYTAVQRLIPMRAARKVLLSRDEVRLISPDGSLRSRPNRAAKALDTRNPNDLRVALDGQELVLPLYASIRKEQWERMRRELGRTSGFFALAVKDESIVLTDPHFGSVIAFPDRAGS